MKQPRIKRPATPVHLHALVLVCVLVLQFGLGSFAAGATAASPQRDAFGNPLCLGGVSSDGNGGKLDHGPAPAGCAFHCTVASLTPAPPPDHRLLAPQRFASSVLRPLVHAPARFAAPTFGYSPRGPPLLA